MPRPAGRGRHEGRRIQRHARGRPRLHKSRLAAYLGAASPERPGYRRVGSISQNHLFSPRLAARLISTEADKGFGVIVGKASGGLTDLDLDCPEAIAAAPYILPRTAVFGHASKPLSHWVYRTNLCETLDRAAIKLNGSDKTGLIAVSMGAGGMAAQTIFPPSTHISGEPIEWVDGGPGKIAEVKGDELIQFARRLAAAAELARSYPKIGGRHDAAFVLGGFLARCGFSQPGAATFVEAVGAASLQPGDKRRDMARTARDGATPGKLAGFPLLAETFGDGAAKKVADWLDYAGEREGRGVRAAKGGERNDPNPGPGPDPADAELERLAKLSPLSSMSASARPRPRRSACAPRCSTAWSQRGGQRWASTAPTVSKAVRLSFPNLNSGPTRSTARRSSRRSPPRSRNIS